MRQFQTTSPGKEWNNQLPQDVNSTQPSQESQDPDIHKSAEVVLEIDPLNTLSCHA